MTGEGLDRSPGQPSLTITEKALLCGADGGYGVSVPKIDEQLAWMAIASLMEDETMPWIELVRSLGTARALFECGCGPLKEAGMAPEGIKRLCSFARWRDLRRERDRLACRGISVIAIDDARYPRLLREIHDPPLLLYARGIAPRLLDPAVAIVGSRKATRYGRRTAFELAKRLATRGVTVVSGLAVGIDTAAHEGALAAGSSAAVLAGGLDRVYPARNRWLFERLAARGCVLTEYPLGQAPLPYHFPIRNRIITGLCRATVVVEAAEHSGSTISARLAAEQGRDVFAVPGNVDSPTSAGTNRLIAEGCALAMEARDVLEELGIRCQTVPEKGPHGGKKSLPELGPDRADAERVWAVLETVPAHVDEVVQACGLDGARVMELLTALELEGWVERLPGARVVRSSGSSR